jgi:hypothetical protein
MTPSPAAQLPEEPQPPDKFAAFAYAQNAADYHALASHLNKRCAWLEANLRVTVEALGTIERHGFHGSSSTAKDALSRLTWKQP